ncbi:MAG: hypothetical protein WC806_02075 [Candidatus Gracilibacteria bacterium]|jgi:hypothetical protein
MKKNIIKNLALLTILLIVAFNNISFAVSDNTDEATMNNIIKDFKPNPEEAKISCDSSAYENYIIDESTDFSNFLEQHFSSQNSTSTLTNIAISRFREYKNRLENFSVLYAIYVSSSEKTGGAVVNIYPKCRDIATEYISIAKEKMINKIAQNAYQKRSFALIEKYKSINGKLSDLELKISDMINLYKSFKNKLPSFTPKDCMKAIF